MGAGHCVVCPTTPVQLRSGPFERPLRQYQGGAPAYGDWLYWYGPAGPDQPGPYPPYEKPKLECVSAGVSSEWLDQLR